MCELSLESFNVFFKLTQLQFIQKYLVMTVLKYNTLDQTMLVSTLGVGLKIYT